MRFIFYFIFLTIFPFNDFLTQVNTLTKENDNTSSSDFHKAEFKGGDAELFDYIRKNLIYPNSVRESGVVYISFIVSDEGKVINAKILKGINPLLDEEALKVVNQMPDWIPMKENGKYIPSEHTIPIKFKI